MRFAPAQLLASTAVASSVLGFGQSQSARADDERELAVTPDDLWKLSPNARREVIASVGPILTEALLEGNITTRQRVAYFFAQCAHETDGFRSLDEHGKYSFETLRGPIFGHVFTTDELARDYLKRGTSAILNLVYAKKNGNGNEKSGDGFRYRGRGFIHLTTKNNYRDYGKIAGQDLLTDPDVVKDPVRGFRIAVLFWRNAGCNALADRADYRAVTKVINGGYNHMPRRLSWLRRALLVWCSYDEDFRDRKLAEEMIA